jgi:hypothetical protein
MLVGLGQRARRGELDDRGELAAIEATAARAARVDDHTRAVAKVAPQHGFRALRALEVAHGIEERRWTPIPRTTPAVEGSVHR